MAELAVQGMCDLLVSNPYFNYSQNIAQVVVPCLNNPRKSVREIVKVAVKTVIKEDKKEEVTLKVRKLYKIFLNISNKFILDIKDYKSIS